MRVVNSLINTQKGGDFQVFKKSVNKIVYCAYHCSFLMIKCINIRELPLDEFFLSFRKAFLLNDKDLCIFTFLGLITVFYFI